MGENDELGQSRLDSLYVIADVAFDSAESALDELEALLGLSKEPIHGNIEATKDQ